MVDTPDEAKLTFLHQYFEQIESQIQFGDNKASLLIAGNSILLAVSGGLMKLVSGCNADFALGCIAPSPAFWLSLFAAAVLIASLVVALIAILPAKIHLNAPREFFLFSYVGSLGFHEFRDAYLQASPAEFVDGALRTIHGKAGYAMRKFRWLGRAVHATLASLTAMAVTAIVALLQVVGR